MKSWDIHIEESDIHIEKSDIHIENSDIHIEKSDIDIDKLNFYINKSDIDIEKSDIDIEKSDIRIEKSDIDKLDIHIDKLILISSLPFRTAKVYPLTFVSAKSCCKNAFSQTSFPQNLLELTFVTAYFFLQKVGANMHFFRKPHFRKIYLS